MTTTYSSTESDRLIAETREDDARMPPRPWEWNSKSKQLVGPFKEPPDPEIDDPGNRYVIAETDSGFYPPAPAVAAAIARTRNNLCAMADQLEAAKIAIENLEGIERAANAIRLAESRGLLEMERELEAARVEIERLTAENVRLRKIAADVRDEPPTIEQLQQLNAMLLNELSVTRSNLYEVTLERDGLRSDNAAMEELIATLQRKRAPKSNIELVDGLLEARGLNR